MAGKIKSIHGIYKKHGREAFLEAAAYYSDHVNPNSIDKTIDEMAAMLMSLLMEPPIKNPLIYDPYK